MRLNIRSLVLIIIGILVIAFGVKALKSSGSISADMNSQAEEMNAATGR